MVSESCVDRDPGNGVRQAWHTVAGGGVSVPQSEQRMRGVAYGPGEAALPEL